MSLPKTIYKFEVYQINKDPDRKKTSKRCIKGLYVFVFHMAFSHGFQATDPPHLCQLLHPLHTHALGAFQVWFLCCKKMNIYILELADISKSVLYIK